MKKALASKPVEGAEVNPGTEQPCTLYVDQSPDSRKAEQLLRQEGFRFVVSKVKPNSPDLMDLFDLPQLVCATIDWSGLPAIRRFVKHERRE